MEKHELIDNFNKTHGLVNTYCMVATTIDYWFIPKHDITLIKDKDCSLNIYSNYAILSIDNKDYMFLNVDDIQWNVSFNYNTTDIAVILDICKKFYYSVPEEFYPGEYKGFKDSNAMENLLYHQVMLNRVLNLFTREPKILNLFI